MGTNPSHPLAPRRVKGSTRGQCDAEMRRVSADALIRSSLLFRVLSGSLHAAARLFSVFFCGSLFLLLAVTQASAQDLTPLETAIRAGTTEQKRDALFQIRNFKSEIASRIAVPALKDADPVVRATAASAVTFLPKAEAFAVLAPLLSDQEAFVRKETAYALGNIESPEPATSLIELLRREKDLEVKAAAVVALGQTGNLAAVEPLLTLLKRSPKENEEFIRRSAARSIGQIAQITRTGRERVVTPQSFLPEKFKELSGDDLTTKFPVFNSAVTTLSIAIQDKRESDDTRRETAFALGAIGSRNANGILEGHRNSPDPYLAEIAREALSKIAATPAN